MSTNSTRDRSAPRGRSRNPYEIADARTKLVKSIVAAESDARDARTEKLRALRLAKEDVDRAEAIANPKPPIVEKKPRVGGVTKHPKKLASTNSLNHPKQ